MKLNRYIDYTILKPIATDKEVNQYIQTAIEREYYSICTYPIFLNGIRKKIEAEKSNLKICSVFNFPNGQQSGEGIQCDLSKAYEHLDEIDVVVPLYLISCPEGIGFISFGDWCSQFRNNYPDKIIKVIIEIGYWDNKVIELLCLTLIKNKIDFVKTCTGFGPRGVKIEDIKLLKQFCGNKIKIKAAGGIKTVEFAKALIKEGADRIGTSTDLLSEKSDSNA